MLIGAERSRTALPFTLNTQAAVGELEDTRPLAPGPTALTAGGLPVLPGVLPGLPFGLPWVDMTGPAFGEKEADPESDRPSRDMS